MGECHSSRGSRVDIDRVARALETLEPLNFECRLWHRSGDYRWTHVRAVPQLNVDRRVKRWIGMNSDISERKHAQLELKATPCPTISGICDCHGDADLLSKDAERSR